MASLLSLQEDVHWKVRSDQTMREKEFVLTKVDKDGNLVGSCNTCCHQNEAPIHNFSPSERNVRKRKAFEDAEQRFKDCWKRDDVEGANQARQVVESERTLKCQRCSKVENTLTGEKKACRDYYIDTREKRCRENGGCCFQDCQERGEDVHEVLEGDHLVSKADSEKEKRRRIEEGEEVEDPKKGENRSLSNKEYWSTHGGVPAMQEEEKGLQWTCRFDHQLQETTSSSKKGVRPASSSEEGIDAKEKNRRQINERQFSIKNPKQVFVDNIKRRVFKRCLHCEREVFEGQEACFDFDHLVPLTKLVGGLAGKNGGVCGLVNNLLNAARLEDPVFFQTLLDEIKKCVLLCKNCHMRKTHNLTIPKWLMEKLSLTTQEEAISLFRKLEEEWWSTVEEEWWKMCL